MKLHTLILASLFVIMPMTVNAQEHKMTMSHEGGTASDKAFMDSHHKMMKDMDVKPTGKADADFVAMMIPHHQGAIDMAKVELEHGKDPVLRKMAEEIIKAQESEIKMMKDWQKENTK